MNIKTKDLYGKKLDKYLKQSVFNYAKEMYKQGEFEDFNQALKQSNVDMSKRYKKEKNNHYIREVIIGRESVGIVWLRIIDKTVHIFNLEVFNKHRGKKYSYILMDIISHFLIENKYKLSYLYVFKDNKIALNIYTESGFIIIKDVCLYGSTIAKRYYMEKKYV